MERAFLYITTFKMTSKSFRQNGSGSKLRQIGNTGWNTTSQNKEEHDLMAVCGKIMKGRYENNGNSYFMEELIKNKETNRKYPICREQRNKQEVSNMLKDSFA